MLEIDNAIYQHGDFRLRASLKAVGGELVAVLGPSGAGKSTLLNIIAGFEPLASGRIIIAGNDATSLPPAQRAVSMVFQDNNVFPHLTLQQNVALGVSPSLRLTETQLADVNQALERVGLRDLSNRKPGEVSGGERQRVALARVLVRPTKVLLLDEPFAALDPGLRHEMLSLVKQLTREGALATLLVSHQPHEILQEADKVIFISNGNVRPGVSTEAFLATKSDAAFSGYFGKITP